MKKLLCFLLMAAAIQSAVYADAETDMHQKYIEQIIKTQNVKYNTKSFFYAISEGNIELCEMFLKSGMTPDTTYLKIPAMYWAISNNQNDIVKLFLENGADANAYYAGLTPMFLAIKNKDTKIVNTLINYGADVNKQINNVKPLQYAVQKNQSEIVEQLIEAGARTDNEVLIRALKSKDTRIKNLVIKRFKTQED